MEEKNIEAQKTEVQSKSKIANIYEWLDIFVSSILIVVLLFTFVFRIVSISGDSMNDTLIDGERVIITNMFYTPKKGDIVVLSRNMDNSISDEVYKQPIIKRVIATAGQTVNIDFESGQVYVDGLLQDEPYIKNYVLNHYSTTNEYDVKFPLTVKENCIFVLGDNRRVSLDSRSSQIGEDGQINVKYVLGHTICRIYPFNKIGAVK